MTRDDGGPSTSRTSFAVEPTRMNANSSPVRFFCGGPGGTACTVTRGGGGPGGVAGGVRGAESGTVSAPGVRRDSVRRASASALGSAGPPSKSEPPCLGRDSAVPEAGCSGESWARTGLREKVVPNRAMNITGRIVFPRNLILSGKHEPHQPPTGLSGEYATDCNRTGPP
jgi:hypothetical protein